MIDDKFFSAIDPAVCQDPCNEFLGLEWMFERTSWMDKKLRSRSKGGSWNLSEDALSEILVLGESQAGLT